MSEEDHETTAPSTVEPSAVACPYCGVRPGVCCRSRVSGKPVASTHRERQLAAASDGERAADGVGAASSILDSARSAGTRTEADMTPDEIEIILSDMSAKEVEHRRLADQIHRDAEPLLRERTRRMEASPDEKWPFREGSYWWPAIPDEPSAG